MEKKEGAHHGAHVLVVPYPLQGHINPVLQFSKRLLIKGGIKVTLAVTTSFFKKSIQAQTGPIRIETFSDGYDDGFQNEDSLEDYFESLKKVGSKTLTQLIKKHQSLGDPISCVVYDPFLSWALDVAKHFNLIAAAFFTQSLAVNSIYYYVQRGLLTVPIVPGNVISVAGLPPLTISDLPSFVSRYGLYPAILTLVTSQFSNIDKADCLLFNSFDKLEQEEMNWMAKQWSVKTIGPTLPSIYLDKRVEGDEDYGFNLFKPSADVCMNWLNMRETGSVVYVSFGSIAELGDEQMNELALCLKETNNYFLWVVRKSEENKLPSNFVVETLEKGLVVTWCPQLEVLSHKAVGCFVTHCGLNSTLESLSLGVPMVGLPQWTDQTTNAKYIEDVWGMGLKVKVNEKGIAIKEEIEACIMEVMEGEKGKGIRENAINWKELAKEAVDEGGSSDKNIEDFVALICHAEFKVCVT
ncbi:UDP-glycosyltransferase 74F2-like [Telopea speciosissima]|uniref:UDP-glycosyltransferase 74F2-like n=1 Tax=Telopea speciosissima TaxID=54955 RepID=UPI001CC3EB77|nr:UDP-glycosyltransferase 74F2-like [Telopea speciosissima]